MMFRTRKQKERIARELVDMSRRNSQFSEIFARLLRNKLGMVGFIIIIVLLLVTGIDYNVYMYGKLKADGTYDGTGAAFFQNLNARTFRASSRYVS